MEVIPVDVHGPVARACLDNYFDELALQLYRASGYREIPRFNDNPYAHHWFEKALD